MLLSQRFKLVYVLRVWQKRILRFFIWIIDKNKYCKKNSGIKLPYRVEKHQSVLIRRLGNSDIHLQYNKVTNLKIAASKIDGIIIKPGETFSFWKTVGWTSKRRGFKEGMFLSRGEVKTGVGGGLCQMSNLIYWMILHTPMEIIERYRHSFDPFPDSGRVLPFGSGASVFYNYIDLRFKNTTQHNFQIKIYFDDKYIKGEILADYPIPFTYHVFERNHQFIQKGEKYYRENEIWREVIDKTTGNKIREELLIKNYCEVKYEIENAESAGA